MRSDFWFLPRAEAPLDTADDEASGFGTGDHDPVLRYSALGIFLILATAALAIARPVALPVTAGIVCGLVLGPVSDRLVRRGFPHAAAATVMVLAGILLLAALFVLLAAPVAMGIDQLPAIVEALRAKLDSVMELAKRLQHIANTSSGAPQIEVASGSAFSPLLNIAMTSTSAAGEMLIFVATVYFYLSAHRGLKARMLWLWFDRESRQIAGSFFEEVESRIAHYFGVLTMINLTVGVIVTLLAWIAGFPYPLFWGVLAFVLNYLALIGPIILTALILGASLMVGGSTLQIAWPVLAFSAIHLVESNAITPSLIGRRLTMSPFMVFLSFVFWLWLWGPVGAALSTPLLLIAIVLQETWRAYRTGPAEKDARKIDEPGRDAGTARSGPRSHGERGETPRAAVPS